MDKEQAIKQDETKITCEEYLEILGLNKKVIYDTPYGLKYPITKDFIEYVKVLQEENRNNLTKALKTFSDSEWVDVRDRLPSEDKDYFVTIKSRIDYADKYYIVLAHWEKSTTDKSVKGWWTSVGWNRAEKQHLYDITNDVVAWKKVEPYERKEVKNE